MRPESVHPEISQDFERVNQYILNHLHSDVPLVEKIGHYIVESGGKRLRPLLVLICSHAAGYRGDQHIPLAAVIEFIHTATLLHDDVVDQSDLRRGQSTANARWGNAPSVLVGDFLYSRSFQMMVDIGNMEVMRVISDATNVIAEGEVLQLLNCKNPDTTEDNYMRVIMGKTATLFEAATHCSALIAAAPATEREALRLFGRHLGIAFQLIDDAMDYRGNSEEMGKNVGDDLAEGKPTLPLIYAMANSDSETRKLIRKAIRQGGLEELGPIETAIQASGALTYTENKAREEADKALRYLDGISPSAFKELLADLTRQAIQRNK